MSKPSELAEEIAEDVADILFKTAHLITEELHLKCVELIDQKLSGFADLKKFVELRDEIIERRNRQQITDDMNWGGVFKVHQIFKLAKLFESIKTEE